MPAAVVPPDPESLARAVAILRAGGLVAFPTETVYGLGADASNADAVAGIFAAKGRPLGHPVIVHLATADHLDRWARSVPPAARRLAEACWPGPLTLVLRRSARVPDVVTGGRDTVGLRVPDHPVAWALLEAFGGGLAAPSANRYGRVSPTTAADVAADLGDDVDLVIDGGPCAVGVESTIVDLSGPEPELLRAGGVPAERVAELLRAPVGPVAAPVVGDAAATPRAPGMVASHYAPAARVEVLAEPAVAPRAAALVTEGRAVGALAPHVLADLPPEVVELEPAGPPEEFARCLYGRLRQADRLGLDVLLVVAPPDQGVGAAVVDRLRRAASPRS